MANIPPNMRPVPQEVLIHMLAGMCGQTSDVLMMQYGISYNTWRKIRAGDPVRKSVAERLEQRVFGESR
ncbi:MULTISPECIES: hypothetical protein [unclassified Sphingobium]|uniref:hypothetical protein n=1 Tax=unclassified Sphingobium TaxID=2611147 RepID=UPI00119BA76D|nr:MULTISPECIES: hypothetical protein [unclassified Sphingobium]MBG6120489.1 hypothetical protein [Sphingobium sp. JAI105]TWC98138.1 hypothetical protein FB595_1306 [Sphingobium sp. AEW010]TWD17877.1 hypothetical protein FB596_13119 [Sphingobium sp. AEW013]TWD20612.1 hypothetical protein FB594_1316 [Sphingobium sp. AEW001]